MGTKRCRQEEEEAFYFYLPKELDGKLILEHLGDRKWKATNQFLKADTPGVSHRASMDLCHKFALFAAAAAWESVLDDGEDQGNGWVRFLKAARPSQDEAAAADEQRKR